MVKISRRGIKPRARWFLRGIAPQSKVSVQVVTMEDLVYAIIARSLWMFSNFRSHQNMVHQIYLYNRIYSELLWEHQLVDVTDHRGSSLDAHNEGFSVRISS